jgi:hypothetical protein
MGHDYWGMRNRKWDTQYGTWDYLWPVNCDLWPVTCDLWPVHCTGPVGAHGRGEPGQQLRCAGDGLHPRGGALHHGLGTSRDPRCLVTRRYNNSTAPQLLLLLLLLLAKTEWASNRLSLVALNGGRPLEPLFIIYKNNPAVTWLYTYHMYQGPRESVAQSFWHVPLFTLISAKWRTREGAETGVSLAVLSVPMRSWNAADFHLLYMGWGV